MFFSTAMRPTLSQSGRSSEASSGTTSPGRGRKSCVSAPRDQMRTLPKPWPSNSRRSVSVATITLAAGL